MKIIFVLLALAFSQVKAEDDQIKFLECIQKSMSQISPVCNQNDQECENEVKRVTLCSKDCVKNFITYKDIAECIQSNCSSAVKPTQKLNNLRIQCYKEGISPNQNDDTTQNPQNPQDSKESGQRNSSNSITLVISFLKIFLFILC